MKPIGPYKQIGTGVYNVVADESRLNAYIPLCVCSDIETAIAICEIVNSFNESKQTSDHVKRS